MTDQRLVDAFIAGDEQAFESLYDRHTPALYLFALRLVGGAAHDAEDVVQEAWLRASDRLRGFAWRSSLRTWLMGFVVNCAREVLRRRPLNGADAESAEERYGRTQPFRAESIDLERAIAGVPADFRLVLVLHDLEGFTHAEIAARLEIDEGTSRSRLFRARRRVRETLGTWEDL